MRKAIATLGLILSAFMAYTVELYPAVVEDSVQVLLNGISGASSDDDKLFNSELLESLMESQLAQKDMFSYEFSKIKKMAILQPDDKAFRIFNWNVPLNSGKNIFFCYVVTPNEEGQNNVIKLSKPKREEKKIESKYLSAEKWYGCLYYDIISIKKGRKTMYTLLGYSPEQKALTKKYIDVLSVNNGEIKLGAPIFETEKGIKKRVIFQFSSEVSMTVRWQEESERIILDHLEPRSPQMEGNFMFYGPDGTFDAYTLLKDKWVLQKGVDFKSTEKSNKVYKDPRFFRKRKN